jgi:hypothetical protein
VVVDRSVDLIAQVRSSLAGVGWLVDGVLGWLALAVFFWSLLLVTARADHGDAGVPTANMASATRARGQEPQARDGEPQEDREALALRRL